MPSMNHTRRSFMKAVSLGTLGCMLPDSLYAATDIAMPTLHIACNQYTWFTFYQRQGRNWTDNLDASLGEFAQSGIVGYEPSINSAEEIRTLAPLLKKYHLEMRSLYVNSTLHESEEADQRIAEVIAIAEAARLIGVKIIVTNPSPIRWGSQEDKTDTQLETQAANLNRLGAELRKRGITLAYHNHDPEMRQSAREFHHMMGATTSQNVSLCLDVHWVYRGSGNSQVALFDIIHLYGKRITELHLRQSKGGIWTEVFGEGDIDYARLAKELQKMGIRPHLVLEQCVEKQSPNTMDALTAHRQDLVYASQVFASLAR